MNVKLGNLAVDLTGALIDIDEANAKIKSIIGQMITDMYEKTKGDLIKEQLATGNYRDIDSAIPQEWANDVLAKTGRYTINCIAWAYYPDGSDGPLALTEIGEVILGIYNFILDKTGMR